MNTTFTHIPDSIPTASRRLAISFLKYRGSVTESREVYDDLKEQEDGTLVEVTVRLITRTPVEFNKETAEKYGFATTTWRLVPA